MAKELNEDTGFKVSIKTLIGIGFAMATVISMWFMLQADIEEAKQLPEPPKPEISRMEFDMKDQNIRLTIQNTADDVAEIKEDIKRLEEKIDKLRKEKSYEIIESIIYLTYYAIYRSYSNIKGW